MKLLYSRWICFVLVLSLLVQFLPARAQASGVGAVPASRIQLGQTTAKESHFSFRELLSEYRVSLNELNERDGEFSEVSRLVELLRTIEFKARFQINEKGYQIGTYKIGREGYVFIVKLSGVENGSEATGVLKETLRQSSNFQTNGGESQILIDVLAKYRQTQWAESGESVKYIRVDFSKDGKGQGSEVAIVQGDYTEEKIREALEKMNLTADIRENGEEGWVLRDLEYEGDRDRQEFRVVRQETEDFVGELLDILPTVDAWLGRSWKEIREMTQGVVDRFVEDHVANWNLQDVEGNKQLLAFVAQRWVKLARTLIDKFPGSELLKEPLIDQLTLAHYFGNTQEIRESFDVPEADKRNRNRSRLRAEDRRSDRFQTITLIELETINLSEESKRDGQYQKTKGFIEKKPLSIIQFLGKVLQDSFIVWRSTAQEVQGASSIKRMWLWFYNSPNFGIFSSFSLVFFIEFSVSLLTNALIPPEYVILLLIGVVLIIGKSMTKQNQSTLPKKIQLIIGILGGYFLFLGISEGYIKFFSQLYHILLATSIILIVQEVLGKTLLNKVLKKRNSDDHREYGNIIASYIIVLLSFIVFSEVGFAFVAGIVVLINSKKGRKVSIKNDNQVGVILANELLFTAVADSKNEWEKLFELGNSMLDSKYKDIRKEGVEFMEKIALAIPNEDLVVVSLLQKAEIWLKNQDPVYHENGVKLFKILFRKIKKLSVKQIKQIKQPNIYTLLKSIEEKKLLQLRISPFMKFVEIAELLHLEEMSFSPEFLDKLVGTELGLNDTILDIIQQKITPNLVEDRWIIVKSDLLRFIAGQAPLEAITNDHRNIRDTVEDLKGQEFFKISIAKNIDMSLIKQIIIYNYLFEIKENGKTLDQAKQSINDHFNELKSLLQSYKTQNSSIPNPSSATKRQRGKVRDISRRSPEKIKSQTANGLAFQNRTSSAIGDARENAKTSIQSGDQQEKDKLYEEAEKLLITKHSKPTRALWKTLKRSVKFWRTTAPELEGSLLKKKSLWFYHSPGFGIFIGFVFIFFIEFSVSLFTNALVPSNFFPLLFMGIVVVMMQIMSKQNQTSLPKKIQLVLGIFIGYLSAVAIVEGIDQLLKQFLIVLVVSSAMFIMQEILGKYLLNKIVKKDSSAEHRDYIFFMLIFAMIYLVGLNEVEIILATGIVGLINPNRGEKKQKEIDAFNLGKNITSNLLLTAIANPNTIENSEWQKLLKLGTLIIQGEDKENWQQEGFEFVNKLAKALPAQSVVVLVDLLRLAQQWSENKDPVFKKNGQKLFRILLDKSKELPREQLNEQIRIDTQTFTIHNLIEEISKITDFNQVFENNEGSQLLQFAEGNLSVTQLLNIDSLISTHRFSDTLLDQFFTSQWMYKNFDRTQKQIFRNLGQVDNDQKTQREETDTETQHIIKGIENIVSTKNIGKETLLSVVKNHLIQLITSHSDTWNEITGLTTQHRAILQAVQEVQKKFVEGHNLIVEPSQKQALTLFAGLMIYRYLIETVDNNKSKEEAQKEAENFHWKLYKLLNQGFNLNKASSQQLPLPMMVSNFASSQLQQQTPLSSPTIPQTTPQQLHETLAKKLSQEPLQHSFVELLLDLHNNSTSTNLTQFSQDLFQAILSENTSQALDRMRDHYTQRLLNHSNIGFPQQLQELEHFYSFLSSLGQNLLTLGIGVQIVRELLVQVFQNLKQIYTKQGISTSSTLVQSLLSISQQLSQENVEQVEQLLKDQAVTVLHLPQEFSNLSPQEKAKLKQSLTSVLQEEKQRKNTNLIFLIDGQDTEEKEQFLKQLGIKKNQIQTDIRTILSTVQTSLLLIFSDNNKLKEDLEKTQKGTLQIAFHSFTELLEEIGLISEKEFVKEFLDNKRIQSIYTYMIQA